MPVDETAPNEVILFDDGKDADALRTIGEVSEALGIKRHVLRYWEQQFPSLRPLKRSGGRRYYRPADVEVIQQIDTLVNEQGYTLKGARKALKEGVPVADGSGDERRVFKFSSADEAARVAPGVGEGGDEDPASGSEKSKAEMADVRMADSEVISRLKDVRERLSEALDNP